MLLAILASLVAAQAAPAPASVSTLDPAGIARLLQAEGYRAKVGKDRDGDPMIESAADGTAFSVIFYGCKDGRDCKDLQLNAGYDTDGSSVSLATVNKWNRENRWGRVYLDAENDPIFEMDVMFSGGQLSTVNFKDQLAVFVAAKSAFEKSIGWNEAEPEPAGGANTNTTR